MNANQTNPNTFITGGVAEFHLTDSVVALTGSGTADAPYLVFHLNTTGLSNINVSYNLRDLDGSTDNAVQQVALQYRVGETGNFTNVPAGYVADATTGPSLATLVTAVNVALPSAAGNQPQLQIRVITTNATGNDEWVGIDDVSITGTAAEQAPQVASTLPANGATNVPLNSDINVTFTENVDASGSWFDITCASSGAHTATVSGGPATFTLNPDADFAGDEDCTVTVFASQVTDQDADDPPDNMTANYVFGFGTVVPATLIHDIQGAGASSPVVGSVPVIEGVVVGDFQNSTEFRGFYVQEEDADADADSQTSEGIFVFNPGGPPVAVGDVVRVSGTVTEFSGLTELSSVTSVTVGSSGNPLPVSTDLSLPVTNITDFEPTEGMRVRLPQALVVSEYFNYDRFGELVLALPLARETRAFTPTAIDEPGAPALARALANSLRRLTLDDGLSTQNPSSLRHPNAGTFALGNRFRGGDTVQNVTGVMDFQFGLYRIQPTGAADHTAANP
ncbi:MAG: Ig-like domain-containing protein, partial [Gaiellaceae bacterium]